MKYFIVFLVTFSCGFSHPLTEVLDGHGTSKVVVAGPSGTIATSKTNHNAVVLGTHQHHSGTDSTIVAGPSGTISKNVVQSAAIVGGNVPIYSAAAAPVVVSAPATYLSNPIIAHAPTASVILPAGHGFEGQYVHDYTENLYDDGSYKPHYYYI